MRNVEEPFWHVVRNAMRIWSTRTVRLGFTMDFENVSKSLAICSRRLGRIQCGVKKTMAAIQGAVCVLPFTRNALRSRRLTWGDGMLARRTVAGKRSVGLIVLVVLGNNILWNVSAPFRLTDSFLTNYIYCWVSNRHIWWFVILVLPGHLILLTPRPHDWFTVSSIYLLASVSVWEYINKRAQIFTWRNSLYKTDHDKTPSTGCTFDQDRWSTAAAKSTCCSFHPRPRKVVPSLL